MNKSRRHWPLRWTQIFYESLKLCIHAWSALTLTHFGSWLQKICCLRNSYAQMHPLGMRHKPYPATCLLHWLLTLSITAPSFPRDNLGPCPALAFPIERNGGNFGCLPLCLTIRSETSGTNHGKWNDIFYLRSISNRTEAFHLRFDRNFGYITVKWAWKREFL